jgi:hypothetical protein
LTRALDEFCSRRRRFAWQLLLLPLVPAVLGGLGFLLARQLLGDHPGQAFGAIMSGARIMDRSRLLFALWPVALALLAAAYAPPRFSSRHN